MLFSHSNVVTEQLLLKYRVSEVPFRSLALTLFSFTPFADILRVLEVIKKLSVNLIVSFLVLIFVRGMRTIFQCYILLNFLIEFFHTFTLNLYNIHQKPKEAGGYVRFHYSWI